MIQGKENVVESFKMAGRQNWKLYYNVQKVAGSSPIGESDPTADLANNADRLERVLNFLQPGRYNLQCKKDLTDNTNIVQILFEIPGAVGTAPAISGVNNLPAAMGSYTPDVELKELAELRKMDSALPNFLNQWGAPLVQILMARFGGQPAQVGLAGFTNPQQQQPFSSGSNEAAVNSQLQVVDTEQTTGTPTTEEKLTEVLQWLEQAEGSQEAGVELLYKMKKKAESNPALLGMLKTFLN